jgi:predicted DNA binding CopG/RHH family protein
MSARKKYTDEDIGNPRVIPNFLPPPDKLVFREEGVKVTITLSQRSIDFFKAHATDHGTPYQRMIRNLLDAYVDAHERKPGTAKPARKRPAR